MPNILEFFRFDLALRLAVVSAVTLLAGVLYVALVGVSIDASGLRAKAAAVLTQRLGREVHLDGPVQIEVSARPNLVVRGLHVANAPGFSGGEFASLGEARLALDLWPLLRARLQIEKLSGSNLHLRLQENTNGGNNWTFNPPARQQQAARAPATEHAAKRPIADLLRRLEIEGVSLEELEVEFIGTDGQSHFFELQSLIAQFPAGQPLTLTLHGTIEKTYPYKLEFTGGNLADLARFDKPWPIDLTLGFMNSRLLLNGTVSDGTGSIRFVLSTENLREFEHLLQIKLPAVGETRISGIVKYSPGNIALDDLSGLVGKTTLAGSVNFDYSGERPRVQGNLTLPVVDLRPFWTRESVTKEKAPQSLAEFYREVANATFSLGDLNRADADLTLHVGQWLSLPGSVHEAMLHVKLERGRLTMPLQATVADVALSGSASADASVTPARFELSLGTHDSSLGNLAALLVRIPDIEGTLGRFDLHIAARGDRGSELVQSLSVRLNVEHGNMTYGNRAGGRPVHFSLDNLRLVLPAGKTLQGEAHGSLLDTSFRASLHGASLSDLMQEAQAPIDFELLAGSAKAQMQAVLQPPGQDSGSEIAFRLTAPHSSEIAGWLGLKPGADAPISLHGNFHTDSHGWQLADFALQLGHSLLSADVSGTLDEKNKAPLKIQLAGDLVDVEELATLLPEKSAKTQSATPTAANMIDIPILPQGISLAEADIAVRIKRITTASPLTVRDLRFDGHIRDGMMSVSPFAANVADVDFSGAILLDLRTQQPHTALWLSADGLDIGSLLNKVGIARNVDAGVDHVRLQLDLHSSRLGQLLAQSDLQLTFQGGHFTLQDANTGGKMRVALDDGNLKSSAGAAVRLDLRGSVNKVPVSIDIQTAKAADLLNPALPIPFEFDARAADASMTLSGDVERPFSEKEVGFALHMQGSRLDALNTLAHVSLPPWGPWSASGKFRISHGGYELLSLLLQVGTSQLTGHGKIDTTVVPPRIDVALEAPTIQLDDFRFGDWSPEAPGPDARGKHESLEDMRLEAAHEGDRVQQILSPEALRRQNAYLTVRVDHVISGRDMLGSGQLEAKSENGHVVIGPVVVNVPGGSATLRLGYKPGDKSVGASLRVLVNHFDYGILARRIDPETEMRGILSLDVDVRAHAEHISELL
ncbi:MAG TPA: AsmA family protein, partial [Burkholderiaceae bacterium]|nr:AsmA family protein [Burkholderiaceae bacterium]